MSSVASSLGMLQKVLGNSECLIVLQVCAFFLKDQSYHGATASLLGRVGISTDFQKVVFKN